jgi:hypothetical protein
MSSGLEIKATERTLGQVLSGSFRMEVPKYQRAYSWMEEQWSTFWDDLQNIQQGETHFLGSIVVIERDTPIGELDVVDVVDGQQRLATASILLAEMRLQYRIEQEDDIIDKIDEYLKISDQSGSEYSNLQLGHFDDDEYQSLIDGEVPSNDDSQIKKASDFFQEKLQDKTTDELNRLRTRLLEAMTVVRIQCTDEESAFKLFETLNDRGLALSAIDLMKNHLFKLASRSRDIDYTKVESAWENVLEEIRNDLDRPRRFFIHYIVSAPRPDVTKGITKNTLYDEFRRLVDEIASSGAISVEEYIQDMAEASELYVDIVQSKTKRFDNEEANNQINMILDDLDKMGSTQERALLLALFRRTDSPTRLIRMLRLVESFITRGRLTDITTGKSITQFHAGICSEMSEHEDTVSYISRRLSERAPDNDIFSASVKNTQFKRSSRTQYILEKYERDYYNGVDREAQPSGEVEHIAPRNAFDAKKYSTWPDYLSTSKEDFQSVVNEIGNLCILEERLNIEASDDPFEQKKEIYEDSNFKMPRAIARNSEWSIDLINERTERLAEAAPEIWNFDH